jgi:glutathione-regulated potassium-efflux system protein KefB
MTAAALLVVLGAALLMEWGGMSMAMGAFVAGVLLSESAFRHQLEADIEPFRGILLGLFFMSVGMSLDLGVVVRDWCLIVGGTCVSMLVKSAGIYAVARGTSASPRDALDRAILMSQGGEFAFVLYSAAGASGLFDTRFNARMTAIVIVSMAMTPLGVLLARLLLPKEAPSFEGVDAAEHLEGTVLMVGFGRFGQVTSQSLLARGFDITIIDTDTDMIRSAATFGFKVYYGDGRRLDVLRASGAASARAVVVCIDDKAAATHIAELVRKVFPQAKLLVRAYDREHAVELVALGVDYLVRETFESALAFGEAALRELGVSADDAAEIASEVRRRDTERFELDITGGLRAGSHLMHGNAPKPTPFTTPQRESVALTPETALVTGGAKAAS